MGILYFFLARMKHRIPIFRTGTHTSSTGKKIMWSNAAVKALAYNYDSELYAAPLVIGHPEEDAPAWGRTQALTVDGDTLYADIDLTDPIVAMVRDGHYSGVSAAIFAPTNPSNPKPGEYYLRHVGIIGAAPPAIPELANALETVKYAGADADADILYYTAITWAEKSLFRFVRDFGRRFREYLIAEKGQEVADRMMPTWAINHADDSLARIENQPSEPDNHYTARKSMETDTNQPTSSAPAGTDIAAREADIAAREAALEKRDQEFAAREARQRRDEFTCRVERHIEEGRALPAHRDTLVELFVAADGAGDIAIEYSATDKKSLPDALDAMLQAQPKQVDYGEHSRGTGEPASGDVPTAEDLVKYCAERAAEGEILTPADAMHRLAPERK